MVPYGTWALGARAGSTRMDPGLAPRVRAAVLDLVNRAEAVAAFSDRHAEMSFMSGLEPVALELKMLLRDGALGRVLSASATGRGAGSVPHADLDAVRRVADLGREALRRVARYEREILAEPRRRLGEGVETAFSVASSLIWIIMAVA